MRRRLPVLLALSVPLGFAAGAVLAIPASAGAQEGGGDLSSPPPPEGATPVAPPDTAAPEEPGPDVGGAPVEDAYASEQPVTPPTGQVPLPPSDAPEGYDDRTGRRAPSGRYPSSRGQAALDEGVRIPSRIATRLRVLDADFQTLSARGGGSLVDGILSIVTGGLSITLGIVVDDDFLSPYLYTYGGAGVARGIIDIALTPDPSQSAITFAHMPMGNMGEVRARLLYGEEELESLADRMRLARILDASINIAAGVAIVPIYLEPNDFEIDAFGAFVMIGAGISVVSGLIGLLSASEAERRWDAYAELRARIGGDDDVVVETEAEAGSTEGPRLSYGAAPLPGGGAFTLVGAF